MKICVESKSVYREYMHNLHRNQTEITLTFWPEDRIKKFWRLTGPMLSKIINGKSPAILLNAHASQKEGDEHLVIAVSIIHGDLVRGDTIEDATARMETVLRNKVKAAIGKVEKYLEIHSSLVQHISSLHTRLDIMEKKFADHSKYMGWKPHGTKKGKGRGTWVKHY